MISLGPKYPNYTTYRNFWSIIYLILVILMGLVQFLENMLYQYTGEKLTHDVRRKLFTQLLHKQISWFDRKSRASGVLTTLLSEDINNLNGLTTEYLATLLSVFLSIISGLAVAFYFCWPQAIVCVLSMPLMLLGGFLM